MIIKGILKTIDYNNNSCTVRLPLFETANTSGEVVLPAIFMNQPGMFNGYNEGDIVFVDFENNKLEAPIIIGKLYLGSEKEASNSQKGGLKIASLTVDSSATLPLDTKLVFNHTSSDAPVDKGLSSYKSIIDIIKAIHTTETTLEKVTDTQNNTNDSFIQRIEVTYLSQLAELEAPLATHEGWSIVVPASRDGYKIWQKTTTYNNKGQILGLPEIICISDLTGTASYWLKCSTKNHAGTQQSPTETVEITAMIKLGLNVETEDTDATLYYKWSGEEEISANSNKIVLTNNGDFKNKNLIVRAERNGITYLTETILYTPLNTPVLRFSKETDSLSYDSYGYNKLNTNDTSSVAATVLLNNEIIPATYTWVLEDCTNVAQRPAEPSWDPIEVSGSSITIYHIAETAEQATATCNAVYTDPAGNQQTLTKVFSISKNRQGKSLYKIDILNEFSTIPLSYDDKYEDANLTFTEHTVSAFYGDDVLTFTVGNTPNTNSDNKSYYLYIKQTSGLTLNKVANQQTSAFTTKVNTITADTGEVIYELYRGSTKVASAKFELSVLRSGTPATNLWLVISHPVHTGSQQSNPITVQPKIQIGNTGIDNNTESYVGYKYESDETYTELVWNSDRELFEIPLPYRAENIKIIASQNENLSDPYEEEEITYSPLNTPVIDLTNDSDDLVYTPGGTKIDTDEIATSTASLWLNGEKLDTAQFTWNLVGCIGSSNISADKKDTTVTITELTETKGTATCVATYKGKTYTKVFSVAKQIQGDASTSYWLKLSTVVHTGNNQERPIEAIAMKKEGTKVEVEDSSAKLYFRYFSDTSWSSTANSSCVINNYKDEDLYIVAVHGDYVPDSTTTESSSEIYDWETITYSPLNTPVIDLTNDRGSLTYNDQDKKLISGETTSTTAALYLNGAPVNATYEWTYNAGTEADDAAGYILSNSNKTITISHINENINKAEAICRATYKGNTYTKVFTIIKNINSVKYWLKTSTKIHTGVTSLDNIEIIAMRKEGTSAETPDTTAHLWYKFKSEQTWRKESDGSTHLITINKADLKDEDLTIIATHNNSNNAPLDIDIYDQETITYSPKNTPVIDLTNDSDILPYDADGFIIGNPLAQTTAELYLNGEKINETNLSFSWVDASNKNVITFEGETNKSTIKIKAISENIATATCNITIAASGINGQFANKTYSKDFKIVRQIKGDPTTIYKIVPSTATVTYTKANTYIPANIEFNILESRGIKEPTIVDFETVAGLELITNQDGLEFLKTNSTYSLPSSNIIWPLEVSLIKDNVLIHKETINKVTDGTDGANATSPYTLDLVNDKVSVLSNTPFVDTNNTWWSEKTLHTLKVLQGITPVSFENITIKAGPYTEAEIDSEIILTYQATNISSENLKVIPRNNENKFEQNIYISGLTDPTKLVGTILYNLYVEKVLVATAKFEFLNILYGVDGEAGNSITGVTNYYLATQTETPAPTYENNAWKTTLSELTNKFDSTYKYLWNYEEITYSKGPSTKTTPEVISYYAKDGINGQPGAEGRGIESITEYYQINNSTNLATPKESELTESNNWFTTPPVLTATAPYLWNVEKVVYTKGTPLTTITTPVLIGTYSRSITGVTNKYLANADDKTIPSKTDTSWKTNIKDTGYGKEKPYLWNYEVVSYDRADEEGKTTTETTPEVISYYAKDGEGGRGISYITEYYQINDSTNTPDKSNLASNWRTTPEAPNSLKPYLWNVEKIVYTDNSAPTITEPVIIGTYGETFGVNIIPSASSIIATETINGNTSSWTYSPSTVTIKFTEVAGTTVIDCGDSQKRKYRYKVYVNNETTPKNTVELTSSTKTATITLPSTEVQGYRIELELQLEDNTWINVDTESISVARNGKDGSDGKDGTDATSYWLKGVEAVHLGSKQTTNINITAIKQTGLSGIEEDTDAILWWTFEGKGNWEKAGKSYSLQFTAGPGYALSNNKDITIFATHNESFIPTATTTAADSNIYEWEIITYSPLNTPILDLNNDSASLSYTSEGTKINATDKVSSTATLYLNGEAITTAHYIWYLENCTTDTAATTNNTHLITDTISINSITANNGTATCLAFKDKDIKAVVIRSGWPEESWVKYSTDTAETWTGSTAINPNEYFVIVGRATDSKKLHIILGQATSSNNGEISGSAVSYDEAFTKVFSISKQLKGDNGDAISIGVENAFYATNTYDVTTPNIPGSSTKTSLTAGQWAILSDYPTKTDLENSSYKLVFHSSRVFSYNETTSKVLETQAWSLPVVYWCKDPEAYRILTTAEGLFGYGQGVYYTVKQDVLNSDETPRFTAGTKYTPDQLAVYVAENPEDNKKNVEVYIDAEYIRTGALRVEKDTNGDGQKETLFEAGLDKSTVKIGGFEVDGKSLSATIDTDSTNVEDYVERSFNESTLHEEGIKNITDVSTSLNSTAICCHDAGDLATSTTDQESFNQIYKDTTLLEKLETRPWIEFSTDYYQYICIYDTTLTEQGIPINDVWDIYKYDDEAETWKKDNTTQLKTNVLTKYEAKVYVGTDKIEVTNGDKVVKLQNGTLFANSANISGTVTATAGNIGDFKLQNKGLVVQRLSEEDIVPLVSWLGTPLTSQVWRVQNTKNTFTVLTTQVITDWVISYIYYDYKETIPATFAATGSHTEEQIKNKLTLYLVLVINGKTTQEYKFKTTVEGYSIWEQKEINSITQTNPFIATEIPVNISNSNLATTRLSPEELFIGYEKEISTGYNSDYWFTITPEMLGASINLEDTALYKAIFIDSTTEGNGTPWDTVHFSLNEKNPSINIVDSKLTLKLGYDVTTSSFIPPRVDPIKPIIPTPGIEIMPAPYALGNNTPSVTPDILPEIDLGGGLTGGQTTTKTTTYYQYFNVKQIDEENNTIIWQATSGSLVINTRYLFPYNLTINGTPSTVKLPLIVKVPKKDSYVKAEANGALTANNATISGNLQAEAGKIGGFEIYENGLYSDFIELSKDSLILAGGNFTLKSSSAYNTGESISLDTSRLNPAIVFSGNGGIIDQTGSVGLTFKAGESTNKIKYQAYFYATGTSGWGGTNYITITTKAKSSDGVWSPLALQKDRTFTIYHKGWDLGDKIRTLSITLKAGEYTKTVEFGGYWSFEGASWTSDGKFEKDKEIISEEGFEQSEVVPASLYALGSILPQATDTVFGTINVYYSTGYGSPVNTYRYEGTQEISSTPYHVWSGNHGATGHPTVYYTKIAPVDIVTGQATSSTTLYYMKGESLTSATKSSMYISSKSITITSGCSLGSDTAKWAAVYANELYGELKSSSDLRLKQNIDYDISKYDSLFDSLKPASYQFKSDLSSKTHLGFIAQEVEQSLFDNNLTRKDFAGVSITGKGFDAKTDTILDLDRTTYALGYNELHALEVRQIQLLKARVQELETKIEQLTKNN